MNRFSGKTIVITGAARGQGAAEAARFHGEGANVMISDLANSGGKAIADQLGERAVYVDHDVTSEDSWHDLFATAQRIFGQCHALVNNAGIYRPAPIEATTPELLEQIFRVNQLGTLLGMKHALGPLKSAGGGSIVNISSIVGMKGAPNTAAYGGTKWAVRGMTKVAALEMAPHGIRVNSVHPGFIATAMLNANSDEMNQHGAEVTPLKRHGTVDEVAALVAFLASDESTFITGAEIAIDGGLSL
ncbi:MULTISPECIES: SDR family NAD(P)-dependent oxidoreductase [Burkholderia]|uniref:SDR family NAD(P)-dependent oxidoreductase n=1 Tax=Burkholderia TaxID=32008 RepID=UPI000DA3D7CA|nr:MULTISPECIES: glucose 1-dehydrogenase [Burkholderia]AWV05638.1 3-alpha-hydroxysteroid dehydrogenase [Burkholderia sp. JP2-270]